MSKANALKNALAAHAGLQRVSNLKDTRVEAWRALGDSAPARREKKLFQVEGLRPAELLLTESLYSTEELILVSEELLHRQKDTQDRAAALVRLAAEKKIPIFDVTREIFRKIAGVNKIRGVMAIAEQGEWTVEDLVAETASAKGLLPVLVGLNDPGNVGTLIRSAYAFGAHALLALEGATDPYHPKVLRASAGHLLRTASGSWKDFRAACTAHGVRVLGLDAAEAGSVPLDQLTRETNQPLAVCIGSEGHGFPAGVNGFDQRVRIPMRAGAESLNAGVAGSLVLWRLKT